MGAASGAGLEDEIAAASDAAGVAARVEGDEFLLVLEADGALTLESGARLGRLGLVSGVLQKALEKADNVDFVVPEQTRKTF